VNKTVTCVLKCKIYTGQPGGALRGQYHLKAIYRAARGHTLWGQYHLNAIYRAARGGHTLWGQYHLKAIYRAARGHTLWGQYHIKAIYRAARGHTVGTISPQSYIQGSPWGGAHWGVTINANRETGQPGGAHSVGTISSQSYIQGSPGGHTLWGQYHIKAIYRAARGGTLRGQYHLKAIKTDKQQHVLQNKHRFVETDDMTEILKPSYADSFINTLEKYHIYKSSKQNTHRRSMYRVQAHIVRYLLPWRQIAAPQRPLLTWHTARNGPLGNSPASYSGSSRFDSRRRQPAILTEVFRGFPPSLQANAGVVP
jgi:hypothetical protein